MVRPSIPKELVEEMNEKHFEIRGFEPSSVSEGITGLLHIINEQQEEIKELKKDR